VLTLDQTGRRRHNGHNLSFLSFVLSSVTKIVNVIFLKQMNKYVIFDRIDSSRFSSSI